MIGSADGDRKLIAICRLSRGRCSANYLGGHRDDFQLSVWRHFLERACVVMLLSRVLRSKLKPEKLEKEEMSLRSIYL